MAVKDPLIITGTDLTLEAVEQVARDNRKVELSKEAIERVKASRQQVEEMIAAGRVIYGVTTGIGKFCNKLISADLAAQLQCNIIRSHATGVGDPLREDQVRAVMLLRANSLARGYSGVKFNTLQTILELLNQGVHPVIPAKGSLGASGDLAPLSHMVLGLMGEGEVVYKGKRIEAADALKQAKITPVILGAKEGLALINGTQVMSGIGSLLVLDGEKMADMADAISALSMEALRGITDAFIAEIHRLRPHQGQMTVASNIRKLLQGSTYTTAPSEKKVQDAYSLRCVPQVHGATRDALTHARKVLEIEINSVTDNPLLFWEDGKVYSAGNFHGQPLALVFDYLGCALAELGNISERRIEQLLNPALSGLPAFLSPNGGINSGFMLTQYTAAALVSESKIYASPASVDSIPTSANQEDHVSMGANGVRKALVIMENSMRVLGIEYLCAAQGVDLSKVEGTLGAGTSIAYATLRKSVSTLDEDRILYKDMDSSYGILTSGELLTALKEKGIELRE
jgi:histidine ammonia-lyase